MTVYHEKGEATLIDGAWQSDNASLALWLNTVAPDLDTALALGLSRTPHGEAASGLDDDA